MEGLRGREVWTLCRASSSTAIDKLGIWHWGSTWNLCGRWWRINKTQVLLQKPFRKPRSEDREDGRTTSEWILGRSKRIKVGLNWLRIMFSWGVWYEWC
jgi:hypothetical protein